MRSARHDSCTRVNTETSSSARPVQKSSRLTDLCKDLRLCKNTGSRDCSCGTCVKKNKISLAASSAKSCVDSKLPSPEERYHYQVVIMTMATNHTKISPWADPVVVFVATAAALLFWSRVSPFAWIDQVIVKLPLPVV